MRQNILLLLGGLTIGVILAWVTGYSWASLAIFSGPLLFFILCPVMMMLMMHGMHSGDEKKDTTSNSDQHISHTV